MFCNVSCCLHHTSRNHSFNSSAIDERPLDGLSTDIWPVDTLLQSIIVHHSHVVDIRHSEGDDIVVIRVVDVYSSDLDLPSVQQELARLCGRHKMLTWTLGIQCE